MTLIPQGTYECLIHRLDRHGDTILLDFTEVESGMRACIRVFPSHVRALAIAMISQDKRIIDPAGAVVRITFKVVVLDDERAVNRIVRIEPPHEFIPRETSVPNVLPQMTFDQACDTNLGLLNL